MRSTKGDETQQAGVPPESQARAAPGSDQAAQGADAANRLTLAVFAVQRLAGCRTETELFSCLLDELARLTASRGGSVYLLRENCLELVSAIDAGHAPSSIRLGGSGGSIFGRALAGRVPLLMPDLVADGEFGGSGWNGYRDGSFLVLPIIDHGDRPVGAISLHNRVVPPFTAEDLDLGLILLSVFAETLRSLRAAVEAQKSEERFRRLVENASDVICVLDPDGAVRYAGPSIEHVLGYRPEWIVGRSILSIVDPAQRDGARQFLAALASRPGDTRSLKLRFAHADGSWRILELLAKNAVAEPAVGGIVVNARDVSAQEEARRREAEQEEQLLQAAKLASLGALVSGMAHEINNPNNFIRLNAENLRSVWEDVDRILDAANRDSGVTLRGIPYAEARGMVREMMSGILEGSVRIERLVGSLRDYSRRRDPQRMEAIDVNRTIESALTMMGSTVRTSTSRFGFIPADALPPVTGDPHQIEQIVINLVSNACQALTSAEAAITVRTGYDAASREVSIFVRDEGVGISPQNLERVTEPFFTTKREAGGVGLGLSICDRIVRNHGGRIHIDSAPGAGTCVTVALPASDPANA